MSSNEVTVHVNRAENDSLEVESDVSSSPSAASNTDPVLGTSGSCTLILRGHETPAHVHCRLDGELSRIASIDHPNYYVEPGDVTRVPIAFDTGGLEEPIDGRLEVLTGYGSESVAVAVLVRPGPSEIEVDETLSRPSQPEPEPTIVDRLAAAGGIDPGTLAVAVLGVLAVAIATATAMTIGGPAAMIGLAAVVAGVVVAGLLLFQ
ncbi:DUF7524 family protein [Halobiforma nitratireducens]|uniref:Uncharacterized protein n=1 Tax=Halobiforma nitratireducens JCM 10879 TaxID=1227454 RepID=M0M1K1_9EURY|nr:hypothetical protein [Halobiforma nitratireducens]EMA39702.1 hypothetical protein C446_08231 [Halobiforma nitratireducens JCM 10879]